MLEIREVQKPEDFLGDFHIKIDKSRKYSH